MYSITRRFGFDSGHRVLGHEGKCAHLHGHRYEAEITFAYDATTVQVVNDTKTLDQLGRVIDFGEIKTIVNGFIDSQLDHNMILNAEDPLLSSHPKSIESNAHHAHRLCGRIPFVMPNGLNPTAENIARILYDELIKLMPRHIGITQVRLYETPNCWADYYPEL